MGNKLTLKEIVDLETELNLIEKKIKLNLKESKIINKIPIALGIDRMQLDHYRKNRRNFSLKRILNIARFLVGAKYEKKINLLVKL